ncbi:hypothetical protein BDU57DRAFT_546883 [Ampelomyces quisqualis]|uniref:PARP-type domain-containing protein n=1 Tax=Ampelomyces quisqualis TaxID=50730 RepID=A0A6A5QS53_AMPQU|nr:hypothetical protein BDU57DRAFT_546883 [Ampelomyces quisqualis]
MATETATTTRTKGVEGYEGEGPKWRLEHASSALAVCQKAACKRAKTKFVKGELRIGTHTHFEPEDRWYMAWRHWGCATKFQIRGLKEVTEEDVTRAPGYDRLSSAAQEQVQLAFENGHIVDKGFKGIDTDLAKVPKKYAGEFQNATAYKVDLATRGTASCRKPECPKGALKIAKGELRLGICVPYDDDHASWVYKHWMCISKCDLEGIQTRCNGDVSEIDGFSALPVEHQRVVGETMETGEVVEPPQPPAPVVKPKKTRNKVESDDSNAETLKPKRKTRAKNKKNAEDENDSDDESKTKPKCQGKGQKRASDEMDESSEPEYVPKKTRSRAAPIE